MHQLSALNATESSYPRKQMATGEENVDSRHTTDAMCNIRAGGNYLPERASALLKRVLLKCSAIDGIATFSRRIIHYISARTIWGSGRLILSKNALLAQATMLPNDVLEHNLQATVRVGGRK